LGADLLIILTDVDGVYDVPPNTAGAKCLSQYSGDKITFGDPSASGRGGMEAKIQAALVAANSGVHVVIASGFEPKPLSQILAGENRGTWFPASNSLNKRRQWLAYATEPAGNLIVNQGARDALLQRQASLLPKGVIGVEGSFEGGSVVSILDSNQVEIARGICREPSASIPLLLNQPGKAKALVHRDQLAILAEE
jgi:glutamate 5-kinase